MKGIFEKKEHFGLSGVRVHGFKGYPPMFHTHGELLYVISGSINTVIDGKEHTLREGEISLLFPYLTHSYDDAPEAEAIIILFDPAVIAFDNTVLTKKLAVSFTDGKEYFGMLDRAVALIKTGRIKTALGYINAVIGELLEVLPIEDSYCISEDTAVKILEYCTEHFTDDITVKSVSEALYVSQSYISKTFSNKLRYGFREYINTLRIEKSKSLLKSSDKKIVDIMLECGFKNQSSFNRVFREMCGVSPYEFRCNLSKMIFSKLF